MHVGRKAGTNDAKGRSDRDNGLLEVIRMLHVVLQCGWTDLLLGEFVCLAVRQGVCYAGRDRNTKRTPTSSNGAHSVVWRGKKMYKKAVSAKLTTVTKEVVVCSKGNSSKKAVSTTWHSSNLRSAP
jgi:hypothetical protein